jgi:hypothetical protein
MRNSISHIKKYFRSAASLYFVLQNLFRILKSDSLILMGAAAP